MAILEEQVSEMCVRHWSNLYVKIRQIETGVLYDDAVDVIPCRFTYEETDEPIGDDDIDDSEALNIILGGRS